MNELKEKYHKLLNDFCGTYDRHEILRHPFFDGVDVCASDTHWLMRIKKEAYDAEIPPLGPKRIEAKSLPKKLALPVETLVKAFLACKMEDEVVEVSPAIKCSECNGNGSVVWEYESKGGHTYYDDYDCPLCQGTGNAKEAVTRKTGKKVPRQLEDSIAINGVTFDAWRLFYIVEACHELGVDTLYITTIGKPGKSVPAIFQLNDDCEIVLMPLYTTDNVTVALKAMPV